MREIILILTLVSETYLRRKYDALKEKVARDWRSYQPRRRFAVIRIFNIP